MIVAIERVLIFVRRVILTVAFRRFKRATRDKTATRGSRAVKRLQPFARGLFDTEFTPTEDPKTHVRNPRQMAVRATGGLLRMPCGNALPEFLGVIPALATWDSWDYLVRITW